MLDAANEALKFAEGKSRSDLDHDRLLALGLVKSIEIIGEAAIKVRADSKELLPEIPWPAVIAMRHRLIHAYYEIDLDRVWDTVTEDLPPLVKALSKVPDLDRLP